MEAAINTRNGSGFMNVILKMVAKITVLGIACAAARAEVAVQGASGVAPAPVPSVRERLSLDNGWRFHLGDVPFPVISGHNSSYMHAKAGTAGGAAAANYDVSSWREVQLPHDWAVEGPFDKTANLSQGYRPRGIGWYRRTFAVDAADRGKHIELQFDGIATFAKVWVNGTIMQRNFCGYTGFAVDVTPLLNYGGVNSVAVRVDAEEQEGWWYEGAGIYRHTWLVKRAPVHVATDGVFANPVRQPDDKWLLPVEVTVESSLKEAATAEVEVTLKDPSGRKTGFATGRADVPPFDKATAKLAIAVAAPQLWSLENPCLYAVETVIKRDGAVADATTQPCGFRSIRFDADKGFFLNDKPVKLQGTCNHQDHAGVGTAMPASLWEFRVRKLKEMGSNAYRCAHNPPSNEFLEACDRQGMLVMDENRNFNCSPEYQRQLEWLVRRDRSHPSVILWSVFNEEPMQATEQGYEMVLRMAAAVKRLDTTRPVTAAMSGGHGSKLNVSHAVDVVGFNYGQGAYDGYHKTYPAKPITSSEDTSAFMVRGEFVHKPNVSASYDDERAPWGSTHRDAWSRIAARPFVAGGFVWTGFDYRGEPTPFSWPTAGSLFGCMDLCGFPKAAFYIHQAQWIKDRPVLHIVPHWNWAGSEGKPVKVMAMSNADTVELSLNGKSLGEKAMDPKNMLSWEVPYTPGRLEAVAKKNGREVARQIVETTGEPVALRLTPDRNSLAGDGQDAVPVTVEALDQKGRPVPTANASVEFEVSGPGAIIGLGNGDPNCHEPEKGNGHSLFNGLAQVILQSKAGGAGPMQLRAKAGNLAAATVTLTVRQVAPIPAVAVVPPSLTLAAWRMSPPSAAKPDPNQAIPENDMNSWPFLKPGKTLKVDGKWIVFRSDKFQAFSAFASKIVFKAIAGKAEIWVDGKKASAKTNPKSGAVSVPLPAGPQPHTISILFEVVPNAELGLAREVTVEPAP